MTINELVKMCLQKDIYIEGVILTKDDYLGYLISGFSKSGTAIVWEDSEGVIRCETRYGQIDTIEDFRDLARVAFEWNKSYCNREPFGWDYKWAPIFVDFGWLVREIKTECSYKVV